MSTMPRLPQPELLRERCRFCTLVDAIVAPEVPSFEFHSKWRRGEQLAAFKDGTGDFVFLWFSHRGCVVRGFDHESVMSPLRSDPPELWPKLFDGLPRSLGYALHEPAFALDEVTFCLWHLPGDRWERGPVKFPRGAGRDPDGARTLLAPFGGSYSRWAADYYGQKLNHVGLQRLRRGAPLDGETVLALNPEANVAAVRRTAKELGWPIQGKLVQPKPAQQKAAPARSRNPAQQPRDRSGKQSFGAAEFRVCCEPTVVKMMIGDQQVVASVQSNIYGELFDLVKRRILEERRRR
jgi:hypothetical protein